MRARGLLAVACQPARSVVAADSSSGTGMRLSICRARSAMSGAGELVRRMTTFALRGSERASDADHFAGSPGADLDLRVQCLFR